MTQISPTNYSGSVLSSFEFRPKPRSAMKRLSESRQMVNQNVEETTTRQKHARSKRKRPSFMSNEKVFKQLEESMANSERRKNLTNNAVHVYDAMGGEVQRVARRRNNPMSVGGNELRRNGDEQPSQKKPAVPSAIVPPTHRRHNGRRKKRHTGDHAEDGSQANESSTNGSTKPAPPPRRGTVANIVPPRKRKSPPIRRFSYHLPGKDPFFSPNTKAEKLMEMMDHLERIKMTIESAPTAIKTSHGKMPRKVKQLLELPDFGKAKQKLTGEEDQKSPPTQSSPRPKKDTTAPSADMVHQHEDDSRKQRVKKFLKEERLRKLNELLLEEELKLEQFKKHKEQQLRRKSLGAIRRYGDAGGDSDSRQSLGSSPTRAKSPALSPPRFSMGSRADDSNSTISKALLDERIQQAQAKKELLIQQKQEKINQEFLLRKQKIETGSKRALSERKKEVFVKTMEHLDKQQETYMRHEMYISHKKERNLHKIFDQEQKLRQKEHQQTEWKGWIEKQKAFLEKVATKEQQQLQHAKKQATLGVYMSSIENSLSPKKRMQRRQSLMPLKGADARSSNGNKQQ